MCNDQAGGNCWEDNDCCERNLKVNKLCAKCVKAEKICVKCLKADESSIRCMESDCINAASLNAKDACVSGLLKSSSLQADAASLNSLCAKSGTINDLCVDNLRVGNYVPCVKDRATANFAAASTPYALGSALIFDTILDNPDGDLSLLPFTTYTAPVSGYYLITFNLSANNLVSTPPVLGTPVANPEIHVNNVLSRELFSPFLTFLNAQKFIMNNLITLQAGDVVSVKYNILGAGGLPIVGSMDILGGGPADGNSLFKAILLSGLCGGGDQPFCDACPTVAVDCVDCCVRQPGDLGCFPPEPTPPTAAPAANPSKSSAWVQPRK